MKMTMKSKRFFLLSGLLLATTAQASANPRELGVVDTLKLAEKYSPRLEARKFAEVAAEAEESAAKSGFMPKIEAQALYTKGFPGSAGATDIGGLMVSPFHHGPSAGLFLKHDLWDFGRTTSAVRVASRKAEADKVEGEVTRVQVDSLALNVLYSCAANRSLMNLWKELNEEAKHVNTEVQNLVRTGQRSIVEKYLSEAQYEEAVTSSADYELKYSKSKERLAVLLGLDPVAISCPTLESLMAETESRLHSTTNGTEASPVIKMAAARTSIAEAQLDHAKAEHMPFITAVGSFGMMEATELGFRKKNWSFAFGLHIPLFEGFKTSNEIKKERALLSERERQVDESRLQLNETNIQYSHLIESAQVRMKHLALEHDLAHRAFQTARKRFESLQGTVVDVREALRNWVRVETAMTDAQTQYLIATADRALLNGARPVRETKE